MWDTSKFKAASTFKVPLHTAAAVINADPADPDILIAAMDRTLKRIRGQGAHVETFERGHRDPITSVKVDPEGKRALTCGKDRQAIVWDIASGKLVTSFPSSPGADKRGCAQSLERPGSQLRSQGGNQALGFHDRCGLADVFHC